MASLDAINILEIRRGFDDLKLWFWNVDLFGSLLLRWWSVCLCTLADLYLRVAKLGVKVVRFNDFECKVPQRWGKHDLSNVVVVNSCEIQIWNMPTRLILEQSEASRSLTNDLEMTDPIWCHANWGKTDVCSYLVDPASSHMLVSKIKPCMSKYKQLYCETANGSLNQL